MSKFLAKEALVADKGPFRCLSDGSVPTSLDALYSLICAIMYYLYKRFVRKWTFGSEDWSLKATGKFNA